MLLFLLLQPSLNLHSDLLNDREVNQTPSTTLFSTSNFYVNVNVSEAKRMIETNPQLVILDVRDQEEYVQGHIKNAILIPYKELEARLNELDREKDILVYCAGGGRSALASKLLVDNGFPKVYNMLGGITAWRYYGYWIEIFHVGDLIVTGTDTYLIQNCTYIQTGNIYVEDNAILTIKRSELIFNQTWACQYSFEVRGYGNLLCENVITSSNYEYYLVVFPNSKVFIQNSSTLFAYIGINFSRVTASNLEGGYIYFFNSFKNLTVMEGSIGNLTILNSFVDLGFEIFDSEVAVNDSALHGIKASRSKLLVSDCWWEPNGTRIFLGKSEAEIHDSRLSFVVSHNDSNFVIYNSTISCGLQLFEGQGHGSCIMSQINYVEAKSFHGTLALNETVILGDLKMLDSQLYISGGVTFLNDSNIKEWKNGGVARNFDVIVINGTRNNPAQNVEVALLAQDNNLVWSGFTDNFGRASFNLTFSDENYTSIFRIELVKNQYRRAANVSFLSETPIVLGVRYFTDLNGDGFVNIMDIAIVARNYGLKSGDPNWDETADLDGNGKIDIIDVAAVARDYGKAL
ncbi:MAG: rhodanese-like domain-containing protein [Candidatus Bathyarchaeia archaeon]